MKRVALSLLAAFAVFIAYAENSRLWYSTPARHWEEALPIGNSRMGAMVYGNPSHETLQINEETFWGGSPYNNNNPSARQNLPIVRRLIFEGKNKEAQALVNKTFRTPQNGMPYQTLGNVVFDFPGHEPSEEYVRDLNLKEAVATVDYTANGVRYHREIFASLPDGLIIMRLTADRPHSLSFSATYDTPLDATISSKGNKLIMSATGNTHEGITGG